MDQQSALAELRAAGVIAVLRAPSADHAVRTVDALVAGGVTGVEITYSTPDACTAIERIATEYGNDVQLGAGTVLTAGQARDAVAAGARFLVSPGTDPAVAEAMLDTGATVLLGALTPSEVMTAVRLGAHAVKVFPASLGGPTYLRSLRGPFPDVPLVPTGGVNVANIGDWLAAGAVAVGAGGELCSATAMAAGRWAEIEATARQFAEAHQRAAGHA
ncbi:bifunctional 4-hydroxy-2-oxoglutarate aldolase/2-dehydro-3-deoxy-phosphogluconate aldolase [Nitriliruptor alkaliphilus]|uniref:bifunctional 4-hydroxy-2-oxoglutarate aldolase/2-dehydro-3-deoxy-phosphogluconate aldolase n=1 Tax=Nitriliruptor alkaliphilus TaxID=427918 RepID=UPI0006982D07|nr:bifunctional 4-hydroxy-2-oxoglutarate aldolase/2-dehydro-3-deoxy-phosphogluconate aldolase [Nitriliruptor alkaliphilus]